MKRIAALALAALLTTAMKPHDRQEFDALMSLPAPVDDAHARSAVRGWLAKNLADPASAEVVYSPVVRVLALQVRNGLSIPSPRVAMCGMVSALSYRGNRHDVVWLVIFDPDRPGQVLSGSLARSDDDGVVDTCRITYEDGYPVHRVDAQGVPIRQVPPYR